MTTYQVICAATLLCDVPLKSKHSLSIASLSQELASLS